ncbi:MAG: hypothetical protein HZB61_15235 [Nitrospirae bacterium]|nr:hypothetical protein [Nitrospirota bacterium]
MILVLTCGVTKGIGADICSSVNDITSKIYFCFIIHNEEDDVNGVPNSNPLIPDYNGNPAVFNHFADAMMDYALMLNSYGATLSFQPDWTFIEGVQKYRPGFFTDLLQLGNVEIVPHAHETYVPYDEVYTMLEMNYAQPLKILGGMTHDKYKASQVWFDANPGFAFWGAPLQTSNHINDKAPPPMVYRIAEPKDIYDYYDLYRHVASSSIIATPGVPSDVTKMFQIKPVGNYITPSYELYATRYFLAEPDDTSVPRIWRKRLDGTQTPGAGNRTASEIINSVAYKIQNELQPLILQGKLEFKTVGEIINLFKQYEQCLDIRDNQDLCDFVPLMPHYEPVRVASAYSSSLQAAYDSAMDGSTIQSRAVVLTENLNINRDVSVFIDGGYSCDYSAGSSMTRLIGDIVVSSGNVEIGNVILEK